MYLQVAQDLEDATGENANSEASGQSFSSMMVGVLKDTYAKSGIARDVEERLEHLMQPYLVAPTGAKEPPTPLPVSYTSSAAATARISPEGKGAEETAPQQLQARPDVSPRFHFMLHCCVGLHCVARGCKRTSASEPLRESPL